MEYLGEIIPHETGYYREWMRVMLRNMRIAPCNWLLACACMLGDY